MKNLKAGLLAITLLGISALAAEQGVWVTEVITAGGK